jgi:hypothetical protein
MVDAIGANAEVAVSDVVGCVANLVEKWIVVSDAGVTFFARETKGSNPSCSTGESATNRAKHGNFTRVEGRPGHCENRQFGGGVEHVAKGTARHAQRTVGSAWIS